MVKVYFQSRVSVSRLRKRGIDPIRLIHENTTPNFQTFILNLK